MNLSTLERFVFTSKTVKLNGTVVFTKEGKLSFNASESSSPIGFLLYYYGLEDTGIYVYPFYDKYQLYVTRWAQSFSVLALGIALIAIVINFRKEK